MKRICSAVAFFQLFFIGITALAQESTADWKEVKNNNYSISFPNDWDVNKMGDVGVSLVAMAPLDRDKDPFRENLTLVIDKIGNDEDLTSYAVNSSNQVITSLKDANVTISELKTTKTGQYYNIVYSVKQGDMTLRYAQYYFIKDGFSYIITLAGEYSYHKRYDSTYNSIIAGFKLN